jgi:hypothetical protein
MEGAVFQRVLINQAIEVLFQLARDFGWSTGARAVHQARHPLIGKAVDPFAEGRIRKLERVGDGLEPLAFDDLAHGLGTAKDPRLFRLFQEDI